MRLLQSKLRPLLLRRGNNKDQKERAFQHLDLAQPPEHVQARLLELLQLPEHQGCDWLRRVLSNPGEAGLDPEIPRMGIVVGWGVRANVMRCAGMAGWLGVVSQGVGVTYCAA